MAYPSSRPENRPSTEAGYSSTLPAAQLDSALTCAIVLSDTCEPDARRAEWLAIRCRGYGHRRCGQPVPDDHPGKATACVGLNIALRELAYRAAGHACSDQGETPQPPLLPGPPVSLYRYPGPTRSVRATGPGGLELTRCLPVCLQERRREPATLGHFCARSDGPILAPPAHHFSVPPQQS